MFFGISLEFLKEKMLMATKKKQGNGKATAKVEPIPVVETQPKKRAAKKTAAQAIDQDAIKQRAWEIWKNEGCPEGRELEHWLQAERELLGTD